MATQDRGRSGLAMPDRIYVTQDLNIALSYARNAYKSEEEHKFGYIIIIDNKTIHDIMPDEDNLWTLLRYESTETKPKLKWFFEFASKYIDLKKFESGEEEETNAMLNTIKEKIKELPDQKIIELLGYHGADNAKHLNGAIKGKGKTNRIKVKEVWRFDNTDNNFHRINTYKNFFKIAKRIYPL
jgi:hypothetical protein